MKVMTHHDWLDDEIDHVTWEGHEDVRALILKGNNDGEILISKEDVIRLAHEFGLWAFKKGSELL